MSLPGREWLDVPAQLQPPAQPRAARWSSAVFKGRRSFAWFSSSCVCRSADELWTRASEQPRRLTRLSFSLSLSPVNMVPRHSATQRTTKDLRRGNRVELLRRLYFEGATSRIDLAGRTGLSQATVGNVISELLHDNVVIETGQLDSEGGRPAVLVAVNPKHAAVVGVDVGESGAAIELFDLRLQKLAAVEVPLRLPKESPASLVSKIAAGVNQVIKQAGVAAQHVLGIGVGVPGVVVHDGEEYVHAPSLGWDKIPLLQLLQTALPAPVMLDNGARTMGRAEMWFGKRRDAK